MDMRRFRPDRTSPRERIKHLEAKESTLRRLIHVLTLAALVFGGTVLAQGTRPEVTTLPGAYGYVVVDHEDPRCTFDFADISVGGDAVWFTASDSSGQFTADCQHGSW